MKLKLFYVCLLVLFVANIFVSSSAQPEEPVDALLLENVEALATGEGGSGDCDFYCEPNWRYMCIITFGDGIDGITCVGYNKKSS